MTRLTPAVRADLAPTGMLRAGINYGNFKGHDAGLAYLRGVVEEAKASGLVARALERTGARGIAVAPRVT